MRQILVWIIMLLLGSQTLRAQSVALDSVSLAAVDSTVPVGFAQYHKKKALVLIFTGNHCVYSKKYEDRLTALAKELAPREVAMVLVNSNAPDLSQDDRMELMDARAAEKGFMMPYLQDPQGRLAKMVGASKNPEAFVFVYREGAWLKAYSGKIDDNPLMDTRVQERYLKQAVDAILSGQPAVSTQPAVGCNIKQW